MNGYTFYKRQVQFQRFKISFKKEAMGKSKGYFSMKVNQELNTQYLGWNLSSSGLSLYRTVAKQSGTTASGKEC